MKTSLKLLLLSTLTAVNSIGASSTTSQGISTIKCTPFYRAGINSTISITYKTMKKSNVVIIVDIVNSLYKEGTNIFKGVFTGASTINIPYDNNYSRNSGNTIRITQIMGGNTKIIEHEIDVAESSVAVIDGSIYNFESKSYFYIYENDTWLKKKETVTFYNFENQYVPNYYHQITISDFSIKLSESIDNKINCSNAVFAITNKNGIFDLFEHDEEFAYFPLDFENEGSVNNLKFKNDLFVNPQTHQMSPIQKPNYVRTTVLYLPINEKRFEDTYNCYISFVGFGIDRATFISNFKYKSLLNTFGDCRNSEYCIVNS